MKVKIEGSKIREDLDCHMKNVEWSSPMDKGI